MALAAVWEHSWAPQGTQAGPGGPRGEGKKNVVLFFAKMALDAIWEHSWAPQGAQAGPGGPTGEGKIRRVRQGQPGIAKK